MDSESCINVVSAVIINKVGLKAELHLHPYKVSWINEDALNVTQSCLVPIKFTVYEDKIWCDVVTTNVGQIILGRPWIFNNDVHIYDCSNMCLFEHGGKKVKLLPSQPKNNIAEKKSIAAKQIKISMISAKDIDREQTKEKLIIILTAREVPKKSVHLDSLCGHSPP